MQVRAMSDPQCNAAVIALLNENALVCPATWFLRSPDGQSLLAVGISKLCVTLPSETKPRVAGSDDLGPLSKGEGHIPLFSNIKFQLGLLHTEADHKGRQ
jgi:hypothetical protein